MDNTTYYDKNREILREQGRNEYRNLSEEDKKKKREYGKKGIIICLKKKKQKLKEYQKNIGRNKIVNYSSLSISDSVPSSLELLSDLLFSKSSSI